MQRTAHTHQRWQIDHPERPSSILMDVATDANLTRDGWSGHVRVSLDCEDPNRRMPGHRIHFEVLKDTISMDRVGCPRLNITNFSLAPCCQQTGIGTFIWSTVFRALPPKLAQAMTLSGSLSAKDKEIQQVSPSGLLIRSWHLGGLVDAPPIRNVERRNAFWQRILAEAGRVFECDENGNGRFEGRFMDPALHPSYRPVFIAMMTD